jgi:LemA protein
MFQSSGMFFGGIALLIVIGVAAVILIHNGIIEAANRIRRAWSNVVVQERQKNNILEALEPHLKAYKDYEGGLLEKIASIRSSISGLSATPDHGTLSGIQSDTQTLMSGIRVAFEAYPNLEASTILNNLMREITEQQENVGASIQIYNAAVEYFNNSIQTAFGSMVNRCLTGKQVAQSFEDTKASEGFSFSPTLP